jgi:mucin-2
MAPNLVAVTTRYSYGSRIKISEQIMHIAQVLPIAMLLIGCAETTEDTSPTATPTTETGTTPTSTEETAETATETGTSTTTATGTTTTGTTTTGTTTTGTTTTKPSTCKTAEPLELITRVAPYDPITGTPCTTCSSGNINFVLSIENPCPNSISFTTTNTCLVSSYGLQNLSTGKGQADVPVCGETITTWTFPAKSTQSEAPYTFGDLEAGNYKATFDIISSPSIVAPSVTFVLIP